MFWHSLITLSQCLDSDFPPARHTCCSVCCHIDATCTVYLCVRRLLETLSETTAFAFLDDHLVNLNEGSSSSDYRIDLQHPTVMALLTAALRDPTLFCEGMKSEEDRVCVELCMQDQLGAALDAAWLSVSEGGGWEVVFEGRR